jgi:hypothetical protein
MWCAFRGVEATGQCERSHCHGDDPGFGVTAGIVKLD